MKIVYLSRNDGTDMRIAKMCNSLVKLGHDVVFVGWDRTPDRPKDINFNPAIVRRILERPGKLAQNSFEGWGDYCRHVIRSLHEERPDAVQAVNEEKAVLALPMKHLNYRWLLIDVFDSVIANKYRSRILDWAAMSCRAIANTGADRIIETSDELQAMLGRHMRKSVIIENAPIDPGEELSRRYPTEAPVRLAVGGTINRKRLALDRLIAAVDSLPAGSVEIEVSGWLHDDYSKEIFAKHPAVRYRWLKSPRDFLEVAATCDALLYIRGDIGDSPYRAAVLPNRIFDCLAVGRPVVVNAQLSLAKWVQRESLGYIVPDTEPGPLMQVIRQIRVDRTQLPTTASRLRQVFVNGHTWAVMEARLGRLYTELAQIRRAASDPLTFKR